jgi:high-affinity K+ transport system ATPase subunit B
MTAFDGITSPAIAVQFLKSGTWTSVTTTDVIQIDIRRGRTRQNERDQAGISVIVFNNTSGSNPWVVSGTNILRDGLQMRIVATIGGTAYPLYYGFLEETEVNQGEAPSVTMTFVDGIAYIADAQAPALATAPQPAL